MLRLSMTAAASAAALMLPALPAQAACERFGFNFFTTQNDWVTVDQVITKGSACTHRYRSGVRNRLDSTAVVQRPKNGTISQAGLAVRYQPRKGFTGADQYVIKVCGSSYHGKGCSTLTYRTTVK
jgi:hypothetical protein